MKKIPNKPVPHFIQDYMYQNISLNYSPTSYWNFKLYKHSFNHLLFWFLFLALTLYYMYFKIYVPGIMIKHDIFFLNQAALRHSTTLFHLNLLILTSMKINVKIFFIYGVINSRGAFNRKVRTRLFQRRR